jgi:hypothetical protein
MLAVGLRRLPRVLRRLRRLRNQAAQLRTRLTAFRAISPQATDGTTRENVVGGQRSMRAFKILEEEIGDED